MCRQFEYLESSITIHDLRCEHYDHHDDDGGHGDHDHDHGDHDHGDHDHGDHGGHGEAIHIEIDGKTIIAHQLDTVRYHTHELPYQDFATLDELAQAVVRQIKFGTHRGHPHGH